MCKCRHSFSRIYANYHIAKKELCGAVFVNINLSFWCPNIESNTNFLIDWMISFNYFSLLIRQIWNCFIKFWYKSISYLKKSTFDWHKHRNSVWGVSMWISLEWNDFPSEFSILFKRRIFHTIITKLRKRNEKGLILGLNTRIVLNYVSFSKRVLIYCKLKPLKNNFKHIWYISNQYSKKWSERR